MDVQINKKSGESFTLEQHGILVKDFIVSSIPLNSMYGDIEGKNGTIDYGSEYGTRTITVPFRLQASSLINFPLLRDLLFGLVLEKESFYIREMRRARKLNYAFVDTNQTPRMAPGTQNQFVDGKRYLVRLQNTFDIEQIETDGEGELVFETTELPFAESIRTTDWLDRNNVPRNWNGMGVMPGESASYRIPVTGEGGSSWFFLGPGMMFESAGFGTGYFRIYNYGNVPIHPFEQRLKITITNIIGSTDFLEIENITNGTKFRVNEGVSQTVVIDGAHVAISGLNALRRTNKTFIELDTGLNEFKLKGADSAFITFDFPFYYK